jgi:uncharacterized protein YdhG (YjbR/CyaY superfamily)
MPRSGVVVPVQSRAETVEDYLAELPTERAAVIEEVRDLVLANLPDGEEAMHVGVISYEIPLSRYTHTYNGQPLMYAAVAAQKHHYALYLHSVYADEEVESALRDAYREAGIKLDAGRSCVRFKRLDQLLPAAVAAAIAAITVDDFITRYESSRRP